MDIEEHWESICNSNLPWGKGFLSYMEHAVGSEQVVHSFLTQLSRPVDNRLHVLRFLFCLHGCNSMGISYSGSWLICRHHKPYLPAGKLRRSRSKTSLTYVTPAPLTERDGSVLKAQDYKEMTELWRRGAHIIFISQRINLGVDSLIVTCSTSSSANSFDLIRQSLSYLVLAKRDSHKLGLNLFSLYKYL